MGNLFLCGFMGCGKTTVGEALARLLGKPFVDMDRLIECRAGMSTAEIFEKFGEQRFREMESQTAASFSEKDSLVVSTGGGAVLNPQNAAAMRAVGKIIYLDVPLDVIRTRLQGDTTRPLLNRADRDEAMLALYEKRAPVYLKAADLTVSNADNRPACEIAAEIAGELGIL